MAPQTSEHLTATPATAVPAREALNGTAARAKAKPQPLPPQFWFSLGLGGLTTAVLLVYTGLLLFFTEKTVAPPAERRATVPFDTSAELRDLWRGVVVQEDGRNKPFDTFAREAVRQITGRERFESVDPMSAWTTGRERSKGHEPIAVVLSWMMLHDPDRNKAIDLGKAAGIDWEHYPFLLADFPELRKVLYPEGTYTSMKEEEQLHGKYAEPSVVRNSEGLEKILKGIAAKESEDRKASLTQLEQKARELKGRLNLYDRVRSSEEFGVAALDRAGKTWFTLKSLQDMSRDPKDWTQVLRERKLEDPHLYPEKELQAFPAEDAKAILAAYAAAQTAYRAKDEEGFVAASADLIDKVGQVSHSYRPEYPEVATTGLELQFNRVNPFGLAWKLALLAALLLLTSVAVAGRLPLLSRVAYVPGMLAFVATLGVAVYGFYCRVMISGRPPNSNMYESIIWVAFMTGVFGLILELIYRQGFFALAGALVSALGFVLADQLALMF